MYADKYIENIGGVAVVDLARKFGTALYVYDQAIIAARVAELKPFGTVRFALKACSNLTVLSYLHSAGVVVDCVSVGELSRAIAAGFQPSAVADAVPRMVFTCDIFDRESLEFVLEKNISVNVGSIDMINQYGERAAEQGKKGRGITIRINPGFGHGHSQKTNTGGPSSKHGIWHEDLAEACDAAARHNLTIEGVHMHIGSGTDFVHLAKVCGALRDVVRKVGPSVKMISGGGGLTIPYRQSDERVDIQEYCKLWWQVREELSKEFGRELQLETEPGRYIVAESGYLLSEVRAIKRMGENTFVLVDAGFNDLARPIMYGAYHEISVCPADGVRSNKTMLAAIAGPLCESGDVFTQKEGGFVEQREIAQARVGDYLVFHDTGAYGAVMGSNYNSRPLIPEVLIRDGEALLIRKRQSIEALMENEYGNGFTPKNV